MSTFGMYDIVVPHDMSTVGIYDIVPHELVELECMKLYHMNEYSWDVWYCTTWMSRVGMYDIVPHEWVHLGCMIS